MTSIFIWGSTALVYALFWFWYVGLKRPLQQSEIDASFTKMQAVGEPSDEFLSALRHFFQNDDGRDFAMVNMLELKEPKAEARQKLAAYQKIFMSSLFKRAGHPVFIASMATGKIENIGCDDDNWTVAAMVRYRSRRDLLEMVTETFASDHHALKIDALQRTFSYPSAPRRIIGGPKVLVPMALLLVACLFQISVLIA